MTQATLLPDFSYIKSNARADLDNEHNEYNRNSSLPDFQNPKIETLKFLVNFHLILVQFMIVLEIGKTLDNSVEVLSKW